MNDTQTLTERNSDRRHAMHNEVSERAQNRFLSALKVDPSLTLLVKKSNLGFGDYSLSAADVLIDFVSDTDVQTHELAKFIVAAADGKDVQLLAQLMLSLAVRRFGDQAADEAEDV